MERLGSAVVRFQFLRHISVGYKGNAATDAALACLLGAIAKLKRLTSVDLDFSYNEIRHVFPSLLVFVGDALPHLQEFTLRLDGNPLSVDCVLAISAALNARRGWRVDTTHCTVIRYC